MVATRKKRVCNPNETPTRVYTNYALKALGLLGGSAHFDKIYALTHELMRDVLHKEDYALVCNGPDGLVDNAPVGMTEGTWPVWGSRIHIVLMHMRMEGLITRKNCIHTLTPEGIKALAALAKTP